MKNNSILLLFAKVAIGYSSLFMACTSFQRPAGETWQVQVMQGAPCAENGIGQGVSACFTGVYQGYLWLAGGCNFPEVPAAEGGKKRFYQGVYVAPCSPTGELAWKQVGLLPVPAAYGVSVTTPEGIICVGGSNEQGALSMVYRLSLQGDRLVTDTLPSLPGACDNMAGALLGHRLYIAGGHLNGIPSNALFALDLLHVEEGWQRLADFPAHPRVQPVLVAQQGHLYLWGGFAGAGAGRSASLSVDGYCYHPQMDYWTSVATPTGADGVDVSLGGGTGVAFQDSLILCTGGVNKTLFLSALKREALLKQAMLDGHTALVDSLKQAGKDYMTMPVEAYRFNDGLLVYNTRQDVWQEVGRSSLTARAGAGLVSADSVFYQIQGELKPGIRTSSIIKLFLH